MCSLYLETQICKYIVIYDNTYIADNRKQTIQYLTKFIKAQGDCHSRILTQKLKDLLSSNLMQIGWAPV